MTKDYTSKIQQLITHTEDGIRIPITFTLLKSGSSKLNLVKTIKFATGLGLKEAKDFVDDSANFRVSFRKKMTVEELKKFRSDLETTDASYELDDWERIRNKKLIDLGICDKSDLVEELSMMDMELLFTEGFSSSKLKDKLMSLYQYLDEEQLKEIYQKNR